MQLFHSFRHAGIGPVSETDEACKGVTARPHDEPVGHCKPNILFNIIYIMRINGCAAVCKR
ncbi:MAG TPA: hypothetical protein PK615_10525, partial [Pseudomonadales bacterium]|nr:hypothetical protein [Pseudomonadales bacterium]